METKYNIRYSIDKKDTPLNIELKIVIEFETQNSGFDPDLGTGFTHASEIPCSWTGISSQPYTDNDDVMVHGDTIRCILKHGKDPVPARIFIDRFSDIAAGTKFSFWFSNIKMPSQVMSTPMITMMIKQYDMADPNSRNNKIIEEG